MPSAKSTTSRKRKMVIVLGGLAGSGKSTVATRLTKRFKLRHVSAGDIFRSLAAERGMDLIHLGRYAEKHPEFDRMIDRRMLSEARKGGVILDGRASAFLTKKARIPALRIFLSVDPKVSAKRVSKRDGISVAEALKLRRIRERENAKRLKALYGLDISKLDEYDAVIETDGYSPEEIVELIDQLASYGRN